MALVFERDALLDRFGRDAPGVGVDVGEDRGRADVGEGRGGGHPRRLRHDDLVAGAEAERQHREMQRGRAVRHGGGVRRRRARRRTRARTCRPIGRRAVYQSLAAASATYWTSRSVTHGPATGIRSRSCRAARSSTSGTVFGSISCHPAQVVVESASVEELLDRAQPEERVRSKLLRGHPAVANTPRSSSSIPWRSVHWGR